MAVLWLSRLGVVCIESRGLDTSAAQCPAPSASRMCSWLTATSALGGTRLIERRTETQDPGSLAAKRVFARSPHTSKRGLAGHNEIDARTCEALELGVAP